MLQKEVAEPLNAERAMKDVVEMKKQRWPKGALIKRPCSVMKFNEFLLLSVCQVFRRSRSRCPRWRFMECLVSLS